MRRGGLQLVYGHYSSRATRRVLKMHGVQSRRVKRSRSAAMPSSLSSSMAEAGKPFFGAQLSLAALRDFLKRALNLNTAPSISIFEPGLPGERERLIALLWSGDYHEAVRNLSSLHPELTFLLDTLTLNSYNARGYGLERHALRMDGLIAVLVPHLARWLAGM